MLFPFAIFASIPLSSAMICSGVCFFHVIPMSYQLHSQIDADEMAGRTVLRRQAGISLPCFRNRKRRHAKEMNLEKEKGPRASQHDMGWNAQRTFPLLPVAGDIFLLTFPFIERRNRPCGSQYLCFRFPMPAQPVDATPSNQLIRPYFTLENRSVWLHSVKTLARVVFRLI